MFTLLQEDPLSEKDSETRKYLLGISCYYHDSAAALISWDESRPEQGVKIIAAAQEERFSRKKNDESFPKMSLQFCLKKAGLSLQQIESVVYYEKPWLSFERILETSLATAPGGLVSFLKAMPVWISGKWNMRRRLKKALAQIDSVAKPEILFSYHHLSHAASAFFPSPFNSAAVMCLDGVGEWVTSSLWKANGTELEPLLEIQFPHSLGLLYSAFTSFCGFKVNSGEYKLMGLAPYGEAKYVQLIEDHLIDIKEDGSYALNMDFFAYHQELRMTSDRFSELFGVPPRSPESLIREVDLDLAASIQKVTERLILKMARHLQKMTGEKNLCLAGGVALNCVANGALLREGIFDKIWIQPAAGDAGGALGAALAFVHTSIGVAKKVEAPDHMQGSLLGPEFTEEEIEHSIQQFGLVYTKLSESELLEQTAQFLSQQLVIGWFQGPLEFGPRALGNRSILADPRNPEMQKKVNMKIKFREGFRPFAPLVLEDSISKYFQIREPSPYMLLVASVAELYKKSKPLTTLRGLEKQNHPVSDFPAVTHVDGSARIQSVSSTSNPLLYRLLSEFGKQSGHPMLLNTSFNVRGEPLVHHPTEALECFLQSDLDALVVGPFLIQKNLQPKDLLIRFRQSDWRLRFETD